MIIFLFLPLTPYITRTLTEVLYIQNHRGESSVLDLKSKISGINHYDSENESEEENLLLHIPSIGLSTDVETGKDSSLLTPWKVRYSPFPDHSGNLVLSGHSYTYANPFSPTFFFLDELSIGESIEVGWKAKVYFYEIYDILIVKPTDVNIQKNNFKSEITLYTCYPKYLGNMRLIIKGRLVSIE